VFVCVWCVSVCGVCVCGVCVCVVCMCVCLIVCSRKLNIEAAYADLWVAIDRSV